jgi:hypothetical protein
MGALNILFGRGIKEKTVPEIISQIQTEKEIAGQMKS